MIETICILVRKPKGVELSTLGIRTALATFNAAFEPSTIFLEDGVYNALDNDCYNSRTIKELLGQEARFYCHWKSWEERDLEEDQLLPGIEFIDDEQIAEMIHEMDAVLTF